MCLIPEATLLTTTPQCSCLILNPELFDNEAHAILYILNWTLQVCDFGKVPGLEKE